MRRGEARLPIERVKERAEKRQKSIVAKCHPAIFELAQVLKETIEAIKALPPNPPSQLTTLIEARLKKRTEEIHRRYSGSIQPAPDTFSAQIIFSEVALVSNSDTQGVAEWIHWARHGTPAKKDAKKTRAKDWGGSRRLQRTTADLEQLRCEKGPIQPFKGDLEHSTMFVTLGKGFGMEELTPEELTDFFDSYCPCGKEHVPESLKKQRARFLKALAKSAA